MIHVDVLIRRLPLSIPLITEFAEPASADSLTFTRLTICKLVYASYILSCKLNTSIQYNENVVELFEPKKILKSLLGICRDALGCV